MAEPRAIKRGDTRPLDFVLKANGKRLTQAEITGASAVWNMAPVKAGVGSTVVRAPMTIFDPTKATFRWSPLPDDVDTAGTHRAEIEVTFSDGTIETFPNGDGGDDYIYIEIVADLG